jgi:hypothetical protein
MQDIYNLSPKNLFFFCLRGGGGVNYKILSFVLLLALTAYFFK